LAWGREGVRRLDCGVDEESLNERLDIRGGESEFQRTCDSSGAEWEV
jgi:hypothetical protein